MPTFAITDTRRSVPTIIDGKLISDEKRSGIAEEVCRVKETIGRAPGLAVLLVGQRRDSHTFVRNKIKVCQEAGIKSLMAAFPENSSEDEVLDTVSDFNKDPSVHGILEQLPLPQVISEPYA